MIYSLDKLNEMAEGDQDFIVSVVSVFLEEVPTDLKAMEEALIANDHENVYQLAHKIKPNVDLLGMEQTRAVTLEMETLAKDPTNMPLLKDLFPTLKTDIQQVVSELQKDFNI